MRLEAGTELAAFLGGLFAGGGKLGGSNQSAVADGCCRFAQRLHAVIFSNLEIAEGVGSRDAIFNLVKLSLREEFDACIRV